MKKAILYGIAMLSILGCKKEISHVEQPEIRVENTLKSYQDQLVGAENGWFGYLFTKSGTTSTFLFQFDKQGGVASLADINNNTSQVKGAGTYRLKAAQVPTLYFDSYSYLHLLSDPDPNVLEGAVGAGMSSDLEFSIVAVEPNAITLKGSQNGSRLILVRAKKSEKTAFEANPLALKNRWADAKTFKYYYNRLSVGGKEYDLVINTTSSRINIFSTEGGFKQFTTSCVHMPDKIMLAEPFVDGDLRLNELDNLQFDSQHGRVSFTAGNLKGTIQNIATPLVTDSEAAERMMFSQAYYLSTAGFTANGTSDAFQVRSLPEYYRVVFQPFYAKPSYSSLRIFYIKNGQFTSYGQVFSAKLSGGKIIFNNSKGYIGVAPNKAYEEALQSSGKQFLNVEGYNVFEIGNGVFDFVSVADSKNWIRFQ